MNVKWLGHACFLISSDDGTKIVTDPYHPGGGLGYRAPDETADVVTVSHEHNDHNNVGAVKGKPQILRGIGTHRAKGIDFRGVPTSHDQASGAQRGPNVVYCFEVDGIRVCHLGDLGHELSAKTIAEIGPVDVLMIPVGGTFTIDAKEANRVANSLAARIVIPMHYQNERCRSFPVATVDAFRKLWVSVRDVNGAEIEVRKEDLPTAAETVILKPCR